jgi:pimeloyl-ACP methyl ester carboxylesterase
VLTHLLNVNGETLRVIEAGNADNPTVFWFHSLGTSSQLWAPQFESLAGTHHLIAMDCRGHGDSSNRGGFSVEACARDAQMVLCELGVVRAHVVGLSMGGLMAAELVAHMAEPFSSLRCDSMVLACSYRSAGNSLSAQTRISATVALLNEKGMAGFGRLYMESTACKYMDIATKDNMVNIISAMRPSDYMQAIASVLTHDSGPALAYALDVPALVLSGTLDNRVSQEALEDLKAAVPQAKEVRLEKAGHLANLEDAEGFTHALLKFWGIL